MSLGYPSGFLILVFNVILVVHVIRTGRAYPWIFVILMLPGIGGLAYVAVELIPGWLGSRGARRAGAAFSGAIDPRRRYRELADNLAVADTIANRSALAEEALKVGEPAEALVQYKAIAAMPTGDEPSFVLGRARAEVALGECAAALASLAEIDRRWPNDRNVERTLLEGLALEGVGRLDEALAAYRAAAPTWSGVEPRVRAAQVLKRLGRTDEARAESQAVIDDLARAPKYVRQAQREWLAAAREVVR
jgi:hypothetical protein